MKLLTWMVDCVGAVCVLAMFAASRLIIAGLVAAGVAFAAAVAVLFGVGWLLKQVAWLGWTGIAIFAFTAALVYWVW